MKIETSRLTIRDNIKSDLDEHHRLMSDSEIMSYIKDIQTYSLEESKENLDFSIKESQRGNDRKCYFFAIVDRITDMYIGSIGFTILEKNECGGNAELGYFILKEHWNKGYTTEAAEAVVKFAFEKVKLHKISTGCILENSNSEKIMNKLGMVKEAHLKLHVLHNGKWKDRVEYATFNELINY